MRIVKEIIHPHCKITVFSWNDKYIIKFEKGGLEQTFKLRELDLIQEEDLYRLIDSDFTNKVVLRFDEMDRDFYDALQMI